MQWYHRSIHVRRLFYKAVITLAMLLLGWQAFNFFTPPQHNPFKPLDLTVKPGVVTGYKLESLGANKLACFALLDQAGVTYTRIDKPSDNPECGIADGLTLDKSLTPYSGTVTTSCRLAASLHMWERHVVMPAAQVTARPRGAMMSGCRTIPRPSSSLAGSPSDTRWAR